MNLYAVIPSGFRRQELTDLVNVLVNDDVHVIVIDTGYDPPLNFGGAWQTRVSVLTEEAGAPKNISRWWNRGLAFADLLNWESGDSEYAVAVLNDDVVISPGFVQHLADTIVKHDVAAAFPDVYGVARDMVFTYPSGYRMSGYAFALRGSKRLRADEAFIWWGGDTDLEWQALVSGGVALAGGLPVTHLYPNSTTIGELAEQAGRDRETFRNKWGVYAW